MQCVFTVTTILKGNMLKYGDVRKMIVLFQLQTGPAEARGAVHPVVRSSVQSEASEEQQPISQQPAPQSRQFRWLYMPCCLMLNCLCIMGMCCCLTRVGVSPQAREQSTGVGWRGLCRCERESDVRERESLKRRVGSSVYGFQSHWILGWRLESKGSLFKEIKPRLLMTEVFTISNTSTHIVIIQASGAAHCLLFISDKGTLEHAKGNKNKHNSLTPDQLSRDWSWMS